MSTIFIIEDEQHAEQCGEFATFEQAIEELERRSNIPWNESPNQCPCKSWEICGRNYEIIEYETLPTGWKEIKRTPIFNISNNGVEWKNEAHKKDV